VQGNKVTETQPRTCARFSVIALILGGNEKDVPNKTQLQGTTLPLIPLIPGVPSGNVRKAKQQFPILSGELRSFYYVPTTISNSFLRSSGLQIRLN
jgi:hypothetical protein